MGPTRSTTLLVAWWCVILSAFGSTTTFAGGAEWNDKSDDAWNFGSVWSYDPEQQLETPASVIAINDERFLLVAHEPPFTITKVSVDTLQPIWSQPAPCSVPPEQSLELSYPFDFRVSAAAGTLMFKCGPLPTATSLRVDTPYVARLDLSSSSITYAWVSTTEWTSSNPRFASTYVTVADPTTSTYCELHGYNEGWCVLPNGTVWQSVPAGYTTAYFYNGTMALLGATGVLLYDSTTAAYRGSVALPATFVSELMSWGYIVGRYLLVSNPRLMVQPQPTIPLWVVDLKTASLATTAQLTLSNTEAWTTKFDPYMIVGAPLIPGTEHDTDCELIVGLPDMVSASQFTLSTYKVSTNAMAPWQTSPSVVPIFYTRSFPTFRLSPTEQSFFKSQCEPTSGGLFVCVGMDAETANEGTPYVSVVMILRVADGTVLHTTRSDGHRPVPALLEHVAQSYDIVVVSGPGGGIVAPYPVNSVCTFNATTGIPIWARAHSTIVGPSNLFPIDPSEGCLIVSNTSRDESPTVECVQL